MAKKAKTKKAKTKKAKTKKAKKTRKNALPKRAEAVTADIRAETGKDEVQKNQKTQNVSKRVESGEYITKSKVIQTGVDKLVSLVRSKEKISVKEATKELGLAKDVVEEWAEFLESEGVLFIERGFLGTNLVNKVYSKEEREKLMSDVERQRMELSRRIEGAITGLKRDKEEIRLVKTEFEDLHDFVRNNFLKLDEQFNALSDFHAAHQALKTKRKQLEEKYGGGLRDVEARIARDRKEYEAVLKSLNETLARGEEGLKRLKDTESKETAITKQISDFAGIVVEIKESANKEIKLLKREGDKISADERRLLKIKEGMKGENQELDRIAGEVSKVKTEFVEAEKTFLQKVSRIGQTKLLKTDIIKKGFDTVTRIKEFLAEASVIRDTINRLETDRQELEKAYNRMMEKIGDLSVSARKSEVPLAQWEAVDKERETTDTLRGKFSKDLTDL
ncbi:MAG: hypothetical protein KJ574_05275, partial [Nanoarchaeota archaeon]|nr:hypothetical protein [Nanoarchaeota archaeon]